MVVVPLIVSSIISGVMSLGSERNVGRIGLKVLIYYSVTGLLAIVVGLILVNTLRPGVVDEELAARILGQAQEPDEFMEKVEGRGASDIVSIVHRMFSRQHHPGGDRQRPAAGGNYLQPSFRILHQQTS